MLDSLVRVGVCCWGGEESRKESKSKSRRTSPPSGVRGSCCGILENRNGSLQAVRCLSPSGCCRPAVLLEPGSLGRVREAFPEDRLGTLIHGEFELEVRRGSSSSGDDTNSDWWLEDGVPMARM